MSRSPLPDPYGTHRGETGAAVSFVGAGNYATGVLIPAFKAAGARLRTVASSGGVSGVLAESMAMASTTGDSVSIQLGFADGSLGTVHYLANGSKAFPKERLEVFAAGRVLQLDNFRRLTGFGWPGFKKLNLWRQDKGQQACAAAFVQALRARAAGADAPPPIPLDEILEVSRVTIEVAAMLTVKAP